MLPALPALAGGRGRSSHRCGCKPCRRSKPASAGRCPELGGVPRHSGEKIRWYVPTQLVASARLRDCTPRMVDSCPQVHSAGCWSLALDRGQMSRDQRPTPDREASLIEPGQRNPPEEAPGRLRSRARATPKAPSPSESSVAREPPGPPRPLSPSRCISRSRTSPAITASFSSSHIRIRAGAWSSSWGRVRARRLPLATSVPPW